MLISSPGQAQKGILVVGQKTVTFHNGCTTKAIPMQPTVMQTWAAVGDDGNRFLLGDHLGNLYVVVVHAQNDIVHSLHIENLGETSIPTSISYLDNGVVFLGSLFGDSQLVKLAEHRDPSSGSYLSLLDEYTNIGPILDFTLADLDRRGQSQVVACCGGKKDGSIRVIRNGIGITEQASVELPGIKGMWSLRGSFDSPFDTYLVQSYISETRILEISNDQMEETEIAGFQSNTPTLFASNTKGDCLIQITETQVNLVSASTKNVLSSYSPPSKITVASGNEEGQILIAMLGGTVQYLAVSSGKVVEVARSVLPQEVSCINLNPLGDPALPASSTGGSSSSSSSVSSLAAIGLWNDNTVRLLSLSSSSNLSECLRITLGGDTQARSVMMATMEGKDMLLVGLGDGQLITHELIVRGTAGGVALTNRKKVSLGTQPIGLSSFRSSNGGKCVFASSDRPTVVYSSSKKISFSNVNFSGEVNYVCPFNCELFPDSLSLATEDALTIGTIDEIQKLHIQTFKLGEGPWRIIHHPETRTFAMTVEAGDSLDSDDVIDTSHTVVFLDDTTFDEILRYKLEPFEVSLSMCAVKLRNSEIVKIDVAADDQQKEDSDVGSYIAVGTAVAHPNEDEASEGRILIFEIKKNENNTSVNLVTEKPTRGGVYSLCNMNEKLVAGINSRVTLFQFRRLHGVSELSHEATHHGHILACYMKCQGNLAIVGDLMRSVSIMKFEEGSGKVITEVARDYNANWMTDVEMLDDNFYLGAEMSSNLFTLKRNTTSKVPEERTKLQIWGEFHLGQMVNKFEKGRLGGGGEVSIQEDSKKDVLFGTVEGMIGVIHQLGSVDSAFFQSLQAAVVKVIKPTGGCPWAEFRGWCSERRYSQSRNFIDGDLCESFLDLNKGLQENIVREMNIEGAWDVAGEKDTGELLMEGTDVLDGVTTDSMGRSSLSLELVIAKVELAMRLHF